jgi:hypothetical protein
VHWRRRAPKRTTGAPQHGDFACHELIHENYLGRQPAKGHRPRTLAQFPSEQINQILLFEPQITSSRDHQIRRP